MIGRDLFVQDLSKTDRLIGRGPDTQRESPKVGGNSGSYRAGGERRNPQIPTSTQALLPTSAHSNGFCVIRVCISSSSSSRRRKVWLEGGLGVGIGKMNFEDDDGS